MGGDFERSQELWLQLDAAGCDVWMGCNDNVAGYDVRLHPLGSKDEDLHIFTKEVANGIIACPAYIPGGPVSHTTVLNARFMSLVQILIIEPLGLTEHDVYVCCDYKDPFSYFQPGYFGDKYPTDGQVILECDPMSIRDPMFKPAYYRKDREKMTDDDLAGTYTMPQIEDQKEKDALLSDEKEKDDREGHQKKVVVVTKGRGI